MKLDSSVNPFGFNHKGLDNGLIVDLPLQHVEHSGFHDVVITRECCETFTLSLNTILMKFIFIWGLKGNLKISFTNLLFPLPHNYVPVYPGI